MSDRQRSPRDRYRLIEGDTFCLDLAAGEQLRIDSAVEGVAAVTLTATADGVSQELADAGQYYLAWRESATATRWHPIGVVDVRALVDTEEQRLRAEVRVLNAKVVAAEATHEQLGGADGTQLRRTSLEALRRSRDAAVAQLNDYLRRQRGLSPVRMRA